MVFFYKQKQFNQNMPCVVTFIELFYSSFEMIEFDYLNWILFPDKVNVSLGGFYIRRTHLLFLDYISLYQV